MHSEQSQIDTGKESRFSGGTIEVTISTVIAALANGLTTKGWQVLLTSAAPIMGFVFGFLLKLGGALIIRNIAIQGAKDSYNEIKTEIKSIDPLRIDRIQELEAQQDDARKTLQNLRSDKVKFDVF